MRTLWIGRVGATLVATALLLGQAPALANKLDADTVVLHLATEQADVDTSGGYMYGPLAFVNALQSRSGGKLSVDVVTNYGDGAPDAETGVVKAIASGEVDGGWPSVRAFPNAGIVGLRPLEAPLTLTNYDAMDALVSGPIALDALKALDGSGIEGLGLAVGPMRRPFAATGPLLAPEDWQGISFRSFNSPLQSATYTALGATPVAAGSDWGDMVLDGKLRGAEFDTFQYAHNGLGTTAPYATGNIVLWPKTFVLAMNKARFDSLTAEQQGWVRQAAADATQASVAGSYDETPIALQLCAAGVQFVDATDAQVAAMRAAVAPVIDGLVQDPPTGALMAEVQSLAAQYPEVVDPDVPADCRDATVAPSPPATVAPAAAIPNGTFRQEVTLDDVKAAGLNSAQGNPGIWTFVFNDGTYTLSCRFMSDPVQDCGGSRVDGGTVEAGYITGTGDQVTFTIDAQREHDVIGCQLPASHTDPGHCTVWPPYSATWSIDGDVLTFGDNVGLALKPWHRVG